MIELESIYKNKLSDKKFIDLFCGLGGFRLALESYGAKCVFSSDIDKHVSKTYENNFGTYPLSDITKVDEKDIPTHDILCAGFPCQAFSISGKQRGFEDTRGTLFREVVRIAKYHQPELLLLENVKNLENHDNGRTFGVIRENIENIGYNMYYQVINASEYGVPQARERIYMVCIRKDLDNKNYKFPKPLEKIKCVKDILISNGEEEKFIINKPYKLKDDEEQFKNFNVFKKPVRVGFVNKGGQGDRIYDPMGQAITLSAEGGGTGAKTGLYLVNGKVRKLHPRECARLMGYPEDYIINESVNQAQKQFGNSVVVDVLQYVVKNIIDEGSIKMDSSGGSKIAKNGFNNEKEIANKFKNWKEDIEAQEWLKTMGYNLNEIEYVQAEVLHGYKTDVQVQVTIKFKKIIDVQNLQIKLVSNEKGFNQIDKRWIKNYKDMWDIPENIVELLKYYTGEKKPYRNDTKDTRRMFMNEFSKEEQDEILEFFEQNKMLILLDIVKGRGKFAAEWILVAQKYLNVFRWTLKPINVAINHYSEGEVAITSRGSLKIGRVTMQRKGGDAGRETANMLQFKVDPTELFNVN